MLTKMAVLWIDVSWEESLRKNRKRFNPEKPDSILEHSLPDAKLERLYRDVDWPEVTGGDPEHVLIQGVQRPICCDGQLGRRHDSQRRGAGPTPRGEPAEAVAAVLGFPKLSRHRPQRASLRNEAEVRPRSWNNSRCDCRGLIGVTIHQNRG